MLFKMFLAGEEDVVKLEFIRLHIENFKSIGVADIDMQSQGIVKVLGVNNYESNASSNGSGKSSIFMALFWALYGRDPKGILNPSNRYTGGECFVSVKFSLDSNLYSVIRTVKGGTQSVILKINEENRSARNRTDTDRVIREDILNMTPDIFLSLIYLNQGFASRLTALTPTARKERLEMLTNTSQLIDEFSNKLVAYETDVNTRMRGIMSKKSERVGFKASIEDMQQKLHQKMLDVERYIDYYEKDGKKYYRTDIAELQSQLAAIDSSLQKENASLVTLNSSRSSNQSELRSNESRIRQLRQDQQSAQNNLDSVEGLEAKCPTCGQSLRKDRADMLAKDYQELIKKCKSAIANCEADAAKAQAAIDVLDKQIQQVNALLTAYSERKQFFNDILIHIPLQCTVDLEDVNNQLSDLTTQQQQAESEINQLSRDEIVYETRADVVKHCRQLVTKSFRSYLLESAIQFLNTRLSYYSSFLFSNESDIVRFDSDSNKLEIYLGSVLYDTLSGGEARKVDLAVVLAQRDLAAEVAGITCNVLVLDEIMESMDEKATQVTLDLLERTSESVESMFIISHNNYAIPADSTLSVIKGANRVAEIRYS